jgi:hypothetical protein
MSTPTQELDSEVTGLQTSVANMDKLLSWLSNLQVKTATFTEQLKANGVGGPTIEGLVQVVDHLTAATPAAEKAKEALAKQIEILDAMAANEGHGHEEFIKGD